jgi:hypothetical protein
MTKKSKIIILIERAQDYKLLSSLLERDYEIISPGKFPDKSLSLDLIIVDGLNLNRYKKILTDEKARVHPLFLPVLILTGKKDIDIAANFLWKTVDEMIVLPVNKTELYARVEMLLRTRKQSLELDYSLTALFKQSHEQLCEAIKTANVALWDWNLATNKVYYSPEWKKQIGFEINELSDELAEWFNRVHPEDLRYCQENIKDFIDNLRFGLSLEFRLQHKNGTYIWVYTQASLVFNEEGKPIRIVGSHVDITDRKNTEDKLKLYTRAIEQSPVSLNVTDTKGRIIYVNSGFTALSGYSSEEVIGKNPRILKSGMHSIDFYKEIWDTISSGRSWYGELCNKNKNGNLYWVQANISPVMDSSGRITHYIAVKEDITGKKKMVEELIVAKEKAEESDRLKTSFLHNISHEIRTPMNAIIGFSELLNEPILPMEERKQYIGIISKSSNQLLSIIDDILRIAILEAGQEKLNVSSFDINSKLKLLFEHYKTEAAKHNIDFWLELDNSNSQTFISTDEVKLYQVLSNLIGNAIKFTEKGYVKYGYFIKGDEIQFYVEDTGIGIHSQMHDEIFKRFRKVEITEASKYGGSGLGLSISKAYVEILGGKIWVNSKLNKGSKFYFTLPFSTT